MKTRAELINDTLVDLGVIAVGQTASAGDTALVEGRIDPMLESLSVRNVIYVSDFQSFPDQIFQYLVDLLVQYCSPAFGRPKDFGAIDMAESLLATIQRIGTGRPNGSLEIDPALLQRRMFYGRRL